MSDRRGSSAPNRKARMQITNAGTALHHTPFVVRDVEKTATAHRVRVRGGPNFELLAPHEEKHLRGPFGGKRRAVSSHLRRISDPGGDARGKGGASTPGA